MLTAACNPAPSAKEDAAYYAATIDWCCGSLLNTGLIFNNGDGTWRDQHSLPTRRSSDLGASEGAATITVKVSHDATAVKTVTDTATISDPEVVAANVSPFSLSEGSEDRSEGVVGTYTDSGNPGKEADEDANDDADNVDGDNGNLLETTFRIHDA